MRSAYSLLLVLFLHLTPHTVRADTIGCKTPDLGLSIGGAKEQVDAMLKEATACVRERQPGRAVAILTQIIKSDPTNAGAYVNRGSGSGGAIAIGKDPKLTYCHFNRANLYLILGEKGPSAITRPRSVSVLRIRLR